MICLVQSWKPLNLCGAWCGAAQPRPQGLDDFLNGSRDESRLPEPGFRRLRGAWGGKASMCSIGPVFRYYWSLLSKFLTDTDVDECQEKSDNCHLHASCDNTVGSFECFCNDGFAGNGRFCAGTEISLSQGHRGQLSVAKANAVLSLNSNTVPFFTLVSKEN